MGKRTSPKLPSPRDAEIFQRVAVSGERQSSVARECGLSRQRVNRICERVGRLVFQELKENIAEHRRQTLLRLEHLYCESLKAWSESKSVRCLTEARLALGDVRRMCGLDVPEREILEVISVQQMYASLDRYSEEELERMSLPHRMQHQGATLLIPNTADGGGDSAVEVVETDSPSSGSGTK